ncbi:MAG: PEGA domain-containing protein, partial [Hymenobacter sp.]
MPVLLPLPPTARHLPNALFLATLGFFSAGSALATPGKLLSKTGVGFVTRPAVALSGRGAEAVADGTISGRVIDDKGQGIPGVTVLVEGTTLGVSTNSDGTFTIQRVPAGPHTLVISFVGYTTVRRAVTSVAGQDANVSVALAESATSLNEAVVVGYGTTRRQDVTGAVT